MLAGIRQGISNTLNQVAGGAAHILAPPPPPPPPPEWTTRLTQCGEPARTEECLCSLFFCHCAAAKAKSDLDGSNMCTNLLCWHAVGVYSWVRRAYGIPGMCGDDMGEGLFCSCCATRRSLTETRMRGMIMLRHGVGPKTYMTTLFGCSCDDLCAAVFCPFYVAHTVRGYLQPNTGTDPKLKNDSCFDALCILPTAVYGEVRHTYGIQPDLCDFVNDTVIPVVCFPCALVHAKNEAMARAQAQRQPNAIFSQQPAPIFGGRAPGMI
jgi:hypothetical protein